MSRSNQHTAYPVVIVERREPRYMRIRDCCADINCSKGFVLGLIRDGTIDARSLHGMTLIPKTLWDRFVATAERIPPKGRNRGALMRDREDKS